MSNAEKKKEELFKIGSVVEKTDLYSTELYIMCSIKFTSTKHSSSLPCTHTYTDIFTLRSILQRTESFQIPLKLVQITGS